MSSPEVMSRDDVVHVRWQPSAIQGLEFVGATGRPDDDRFAFRVCVAARVGLCPIE